MKAMILFLIKAYNFTVRTVQRSDSFISLYVSLNSCLLYLLMLQPDFEIVVRFVFMSYIDVSTASFFFKKINKIRHERNAL